MICPNCSNKDTKVLDSREDDDSVRRRRICHKCQFRFTTFERIEKPRMKVLKKNGCKENYERSKLEKGIRLAFEKRPFKESDILALVSDIEQEILKIAKDKLISSRQIGDLVINKLRNIDEVAYIRFISVYKKFGSVKKFKSEIDKLDK